MHEDDDDVEVAISGVAVANVGERVPKPKQPLDTLEGLNAYLKDWYPEELAKRTGILEVRQSDLDFADAYKDFWQMYQKGRHVVLGEGPSKIRGVVDKGVYLSDYKPGEGSSWAEQRRERVKARGYTLTQPRQVSAGRPDGGVLYYPGLGTVDNPLGMGPTVFPWRIGRCPYVFSNQHDVAIPTHWESPDEWAELLPAMQCMAESSVQGASFQVDFPNPMAAEIIPRQRDVLRSLREQLRPWPELSIYAISPRFIYYRGGKLGYQAPSRWGSRPTFDPTECNGRSGSAAMLKHIRDMVTGNPSYMPTSGYDGAAIRVSIYHGHAWLVGVTLGKKHVLPGAFWVTPDGDFICSVWCQRETYASRDGVNMIVGQELNLAQWMATAGMRQFGLNETALLKCGATMPHPMSDSIKIYMGKRLAAVAGRIALRASSIELGPPSHKMAVVVNPLEPYYRQLVRDYNAKQIGDKILSGESIGLNFSPGSIAVYGKLGDVVGHLSFAYTTDNPIKIGDRIIAYRISAGNEPTPVLNYAILTHLNSDPELIALVNEALNLAPEEPAP